MTHHWLRYLSDPSLRAAVNIALAWRMDALNKAALHEQRRRATFEFEDDESVPGFAVSPVRGRN